jgi:hypothetical protein
MTDDPTDKTVSLDGRRTILEQKATDIRRLLQAVAADEQILRARRAELEAHLAAAPAQTWLEAADKARYLLTLFASVPGGLDPLRRKLVDAVLADFRRLSGEG